MSKLLRFLVLVCVVQAVAAQGLFKGFVPDENGTNLDAQRASKKVQQKVAPGTIIKDCPECPEMVVLSGGSFMMGSPPDQKLDPFTNEPPKFTGEFSERPQHRVRIQSFAIGKYELTQEQWYAVMGDNPSKNRGRTLPVEQVSFGDVQDFIFKLNQKTGQTYRLPSESEWEYAARGGTTTQWNFGEDASQLGRYAWYDQNSEGQTHEVGQKLPNAFGLFDMLGNVWEWTQDNWHESYDGVPPGAPIDGSAWTWHASGGSLVIRGGSYYSQYSTDFRSAKRFQGIPGGRTYVVGFRLARDL